MIESLRSTFSFGPINIPWLFISLFLSWGIYRLVSGRIYHDRKERLQAVNRVLSNCFLIIIVVWKLSPLIFQFDSVISNPAALLYLPGGTAGMVLSSAAAVVYGLFAVIRHKDGGRRISFLKSLGFSGGILLMIIAAAGLGTGMLVDRWSRGDGQHAAGVGVPAPDFVLDAEDGKTYSLADYSGRTVVINFWASWCPPCRAELPELKLFYEKIDPEQTVFLSVNMYTTESDPAGLPDFIEAEGLEFPVLYDRNGLTAGAYGVQSIPTTVIIGRNGNIHAVRTGAVTEAMLERLVSETD